MTASLRRSLRNTVLIVLATGNLLAGGPADDSAARSLQYLRRVMDQYHNRFPVYDDVSSAGNHFHAYAKIPNENAPVAMNGSWTENPHSGATAIRCEFTPTQDANFGGFYLQNGTLTGTDRAPKPNFGEVLNAGIDLTGATALTFWARGARGGEQIEFFMAGVGWNPETTTRIAPYPDSAPRQPVQGTEFGLTTAWQKFTVNLAGMDLRSVLGGFAWVADTAHNPAGAVFFLDDIQYELNASRLDQRLNEPRFLASFTTLPLQPDPFDAVTDGDIDFVLRNLAFTYDNALAILAFLADGSADSVRRARLIGDAFRYAVSHDRTFKDDVPCDQPVDPRSVHGARLRSAYAAGDLSLPPGWTPNDLTGTVPIPGFYAESTQTFYEIEQQGIDVGNNAWAQIALEALYRRTGKASYLETACKLANFIHAFRKDSGAFQGFTGGSDDPEQSRTTRPYASAEHNLDVNAAFSSLFDLTGDKKWAADAQHAREFVAAMWDDQIHCYLTGTTDPNTRNGSPEALPLDVQAWSVLTVPSLRALHPNVLTCAETNHLTTRDGFTGFDFNNDRDGVWFEGTAQMSVAYAVSGQTAAAELYRDQLRRAQQTLGDGQGLPASSHDGLTTGFSFKYFRRLHVGATAWNVFAQLEFNPYFGQPVKRRAAGRASP